MKSKRIPRKSTPPHLVARIQVLQKRIKKNDADALLITNPKDIRYLTGFVGDDSWAVVPAKGDAVRVISDFRFEEQIQREAPYMRVTMREGAISDALVQVRDELGFKHLAVQNDHMTLAQFKQLKKKLGKRRLEPMDDGLLKQRAVKDDAEVRAIRAALTIQQDAFGQMLKLLTGSKPVTEAYAAAQLELTMRIGGADGPSFPTIIAADANASLPHAIPGRAKIKSGGIVLVDWGARSGGYCSDLTRVVAIGRMPAKIREIYKVTLDAQLAAIDAIAPGRTFKEIDAVVRDLITAAGYGDRFGHSLGHGIGLDIHEQPTLSSRSEGVLEPGHVVTVEPGIYLPGIGGVRIEDDILVTRTGCEVLSDLPKDLESAII